MITHDTSVTISALDVATDAADVVGHLFKQYYQESALCVYGFVEGKDDPSFYRHMIERELPDGWTLRLYPAGTKSKVYRTYNGMDWSRFNGERICFFVDRDLQDFISEPNMNANNIYVTDGYSIENHVVDGRMVIGFLADVYDVGMQNPKDEAELLACFKTNESVFCEAMMPIMAQILVWRRCAVAACLSDVKLKDMFTFVGVSCKPKSRSELLQALCKQVGCDLSSDDEVIAAETEIRRHQWPNRMVRGKFVLWHFIQQCYAISQSITDILPSYSGRIRKRIEHGPTNAMVLIGPRMHTPPSLKSFISENYLNFIRNLA
ncbi:MAG: DUF4435 domain-containing protein [Chthonomonadales bacterium]